MRARTPIDWLATWAPAVVVACLLASLIGAWSRGATGLFNVLGFVVGGMALTLWIARGLRDQLCSKEELGFTRTRDFIAYELTGKGMPHGSYALGFSAWLTWLVTGVNSACGWLAFSSFMLVVAWVRANVRYPADPTSP